MYQKILEGCKLHHIGCYIVKLILFLQVGPEILPTVHWLSMVIDTLLSIVSSSNRRPKGQVFPWFVHVSTAQILQ